MTWVAVAIGGAAVIGGGASYLGSKKQSDASKKAAGMNLDQFRTINAQQQPFIQGGYGALSKLNTLLGLSPRQMSGGGGGMPGGASSGNFGQTADQAPPQSQQSQQGARLRQLLMIRAAHGDRQAQQMLQGGP